MSSKLKERFARLGRVQDVDRVSSGSPVVFVLKPIKLPDAGELIDAAMVLARRGVSLAQAKRAIEQLIERSVVAVELPAVEDKVAVVRELKVLKIAATAIRTDAVDVRSLRTKSGLSQSQFALLHNLSLDTLQKWESGERVPDRAAMNYLREIELLVLVGTLGQRDWSIDEVASGADRSKVKKGSANDPAEKRRTRA